MSSSFPPLAALSLTHFDDIKGQSVIFYASSDNIALPTGQIEYITLPSGLHVLTSDLVLFTHHHLPGIGLFRSRDTEDGGRGRRMGTLGVVLAFPGTPADLFDLGPLLEKLYDQIEALPSSPFTPHPSKTTALLQNVFDDVRADPTAVASASSNSPTDLRDLIDGHQHPSPRHPITYFPTSLTLLGPVIVPIYRAASSGQRILMYSQPPLLPSAAFTWCLWAMSLPPPSAHSSAARSVTSEWIGNVGLMDLVEMKSRKGGWIATTSDAIYRSHPRSYDVFIDLSCSPCAVLSSSPNAETQPLTYTFADLPLYRSLLLLSTSPPSVHTTSTGLWMLAFELLERVWRLCVGVCEYAIGRGRVGDIRIGEDEGQVSGEEDARLLRDMEEPDGFDGGEEDEAVRKGRLILRQFQHNSYHLHARLREVTKGDLTGRLTEAQLRELCGTRWNMFGGKVGSTAEGRLWSHLARVWGMTSEDGNA